MPAGIDPAGFDEMRHPGIGELAVGEGRAEMAEGAVAPADEQAQAALGGGGIAGPAGRIVARERVAKIVERRAAGDLGFQETPPAPCRDRRRSVCRPRRARRRKRADRSRKSSRSERTSRAAPPGPTPISRPSRRGRRFCAHSESCAPSQPNQRLERRLNRLGALRSTIRCPRLRGRPSVQALSGGWQVAQETAPETDSRGSKNSARPKTMAAGLPETRLLGSGHEAGGQGPWRRIRRSSSAVKSSAGAAMPERRTDYDCKPRRQGGEGRAGPPGRHSSTVSAVSFSRPAAPRISRISCQRPGMWNIRPSAVPDEPSSVTPGR